VCLTVGLQESGDVVGYAERHQYNRHYAAERRQHFQHDRRDILQQTNNYSS